MSVSHGAAVAAEGLFSASLAESDPEIAAAIARELRRQRDQIELIASENIVSRAVLEAQGSVLTNKYAEGYPGKRYYGGCEFVDVAEQLAIDRAKQLFGCAFANVQPHSGAAGQSRRCSWRCCSRATPSSASICRRRASDPRRAGQSVRQVVQARCPTACGARTQRIDIDEVERLAKAATAEADHRRRLGLSAHHRFRALPRASPTRSAPISWSTWRISPGWSPAACIPRPLPHAHVVTTTTHKTLRGPRGGMILANDEEIGKKINSAVFPGLQGGPLMHVIAAKAVALRRGAAARLQGLRPRVVDNAKALAATLIVARPRHRLRRHRHASDAGRSPAEAADRQGRREGARSAPASPATRTAFPSIRKSRR